MTYSNGDGGSMSNAKPIVEPTALPTIVERPLKPRENV